MSDSAHAGSSLDDEELFDAVVIGTGFGGAVAACRLAQAKKKICILERGRRYAAGDFPRPARRPDNLPNTARWSWAIDHGLWEVKDLHGMLAVQAAGYGGGSLVYANVHLRAPQDAISTGNNWPECYTRESLDPYYDIVAAMLRVRPFPVAGRGEPPPPPGLGKPPEKLLAFQGAAERLERGKSFFRPPLAIDFDNCNQCGECIAGCQRGAKNTLDRNYLAAAERVGDVDVRTLAEVQDIGEEDGSYIVRYRDHLARFDTAVRAKSVFLCAGAVNSTHILLRSTEKLHLANPDAIGKRFFSNGDSIAVVFDTATNPAPAPTRGPTITSALLYNEAGGPVAADKGGRDGNRPGDWFLLQDGGYPSWLEHSIGAFRGEYWLARNRIARPRNGSRRGPHTATKKGEAKNGEDFVTALLGLLDAQHALGRHRSGRPHSPEKASRMSSDPGNILPDQIRERLLKELRSFLGKLEERELKAVSLATMAETFRSVVDSWPRWLRPFVEPLAKVFELGLAPYVPPATVDVFNRRLLRGWTHEQDPFATRALLKIAEEAAQKLLLGKRPDANAFVILGMGIDRAPGRLQLGGHGELLGYWDAASNAVFSSKQERLMHDVATELSGEMRLNPDTTAMQRPVSVHCLGGCAMSTKPEDGVVDPDGKVWGTRALYVLDGSVLPGPVGANPSATIAAIAERNIRKALGDRKSPIFCEEEVPLDPPIPEAPLWQIRQDLRQTAEVLDPVAQIPGKAATPRAKAVGLRFYETMRGSFTTRDSGEKPIVTHLHATIPDLNEFLANPGRRVEVTGSDIVLGDKKYPATGTIALLKRVEVREEMHALYAELNVLQNAWARDWKEVQLAPGTQPMEGPWAARSPEMSDWPDDKKAAYDRWLHRMNTECEMWLQRWAKARRRYRMDYRLDLHDEHGDLICKFEGTKNIRGGPGSLAAWTETTTLTFDLVPLHGDAPAGHGTLRVHIADFLKEMLPSFHVEGADDDDLRMAWAYGRFFRFFLGTLSKVYLPNLQFPDPLGDRVEDSAP